MSIKREKSLSSFHRRSFFFFFFFFLLLLLLLLHLLHLLQYFGIFSWNFRFFLMLSASSPYDESSYREIESPPGDSAVRDGVKPRSSPAPSPSFTCNFILIPLPILSLSLSFLHLRRMRKINDARLRSERVKISQFSFRPASFNRVVLILPSHLFHPLLPILLLRLPRP